MKGAPHVQEVDAAIVQGQVAAPDAGASPGLVNCRGGRARHSPGRPPSPQRRAYGGGLGGGLPPGSPGGGGGGEEGDTDFSRALGSSPRKDRRPLTAAVLGAIAALFVVLSRWPLDAKLRLVGAACCAQSPARTLRIGGSLMPLDARDAGIYLAIPLAVLMAFLVGRGRAGRFPPGAILALLGGVFLAMVLDGVNSSLQTRGLHPLYHDTNAVRVVTGVGAGLALVMLGLPLVNRVVWRAPSDDAVAASYGELGGFVAAGAVLAALLLAPRPWLYYPLSILATLGVLVSWGLINGTIAALATRRENRAVTLADGALLLLVGVVLTLGEVAVVDMARLAGH